MKIMKQKILLTVLTGFIALGAVFMVPSLTPVYAQSPCANGADCPQSGLNDVGSAFPQGARQATDIKKVIKLVIDWALYLAAIIAVVFIIIGGFMYITSAGDPGKAGKGRTTLVNALIGLTIIVLSYLIVQIVYNFLVQR